MEITEALPIIIPNMVRLLRILFASRVVIAIWILSENFIELGFDFYFRKDFLVICRGLIIFNPPTFFSMELGVKTLTREK
jgi:hypothetical protein